MNTLIERPEFWEIIFSIVAAIWAAVQTSNAYVQYRQRTNTEKLGKAFAIIESAVQDTYENYVRTIKTESADGRLSSDERKYAKDMAVRNAIAKGKAIGLDLVQLLTQYGVETYVQRTVKEKKAGEAKAAISRAQELVVYTAAKTAFPKEETQAGKTEKS